MCLHPTILPLTSGGAPSVGIHGGELQLRRVVGPENAEPRRLKDFRDNGRRGIRACEFHRTQTTAGVGDDRLSRSFLHLRCADSPRSRQEGNGQLTGKLTTRGLDSMRRLAWHSRSVLSRLRLPKTGIGTGPDWRWYLHQSKGLRKTIAGRRGTRIGLARPILLPNCYHRRTPPQDRNAPYPQGAAPPCRRERQGTECGHPAGPCPPPDIRRTEPARAVPDTRDRIGNPRTPAAPGWPGAEASPIPVLSPTLHRAAGRSGLPPDRELPPPSRSAGT